MKSSFIFALLLFVSAAGICSTSAQTNGAATPATAGATDQEQRTIDKHAKPILKALALNNAAKEARVRAIIGEYIKALDAWHPQHDAEIKELWQQFNQAHGKQDQAATDAALAKIDAVYASFKPQHEKFLGDLSSVLTPPQVETAEDVLTINKVKITFNAYGEIFHGLTDAQKAFILKNLQAAREEAIDAGSMTEKSAFFKKYKTKIEAYLTAQGYDVKQSYRDFVAKQKAESTAKKAAAQKTTGEKP